MTLKESARKGSRKRRVKVCVVMIKDGSVADDVLFKHCKRNDVVDWREFLFEAIKGMGDKFLLEVLTRKNYQNQTAPVATDQAEGEKEGGGDRNEPGEVELNSRPIPSPRVYTISAVGQVNRSSRFYAKKLAPFIRISGFWLRKYGFDTGAKYLVYPSRDQLILKTGKAIKKDFRLSVKK